MTFILIMNIDYNSVFMINIGYYQFSITTATTTLTINIDELAVIYP